MFTLELIFNKQQISKSYFNPFNIEVWNLFYTFQVYYNFKEHVNTNNKFENKLDII